MAYFVRYEKALSDYGQWLKDLTVFLDGVEKNIFQNDKSDFLAEKLVSVTIASVFVTIGTWLLAIVGFVSGGVVGAGMFFIIGWLLSKNVNSKVFGSERSREEISAGEDLLLSEKDRLIEFFRPITKKLRIQSTRKDVAFTQYNLLHNMLMAFSTRLTANNSKNLAYKYRYRHKESIQQSIRLINNFNRIYAPQYIKKK
jgi:uncharacterized membrane protein YhiD involved in acid resistance